MSNRTIIIWAKDNEESEAAECESTGCGVWVSIEKGMTSYNLIYIYICIDSI